MNSLKKKKNKKKSIFKKKRDYWFEEKSFKKKLVIHEHIVFGLCFEYDFFREKKQTKLKTNSTINHKITLTYKLQTYCSFFWLTFMFAYLLCGSFNSMAFFN